MILSYEMAFIADEALNKIGMPRYLTAMSPNFCQFTKEQLGSITNMELTNMSKIKELIYFKNLINLTIVSEDYDKIVSTDPISGNKYVNHIEDFSVISRLTNLENLTIMNDTNLATLNIEKLKKLKTIKLINNPSFKKISGLDSLEELKEVVIYGNNLDCAIDIETYINNTISTSPNILDIKMYNKIVGANSEIAKDLSDKFILGLTFLKFAEKNGFVNLTILDNRNLAEMYTKLKHFFERTDMYRRSEYDKVLFVYSYVIRNVRFAEDELKKRLSKYNEVIKETNEIPKYMEKSFASLHSSYNAYHFKTANCEGIVNLMGFMLDMLGVENVNVHCSDKRNGLLNGTNHSMLRVKVDNEWYYCDPVYDTKKPNEYFLMTKDKVTKIHEISSYENIVVGENTDGKFNTKNLNRRK